MGDAKELAQNLLDFVTRTEEKHKDEVEDAFRRGKADGYRQALLEFEDGLSESGVTADDIFEAGFLKGAESAGQKKPEIILKKIMYLRPRGYSKSYFMVSAIIGICKEFGYCPDILGWECYPDCGGRAELCDGCWKKARETAENKD